MKEKELLATVTRQARDKGWLVFHDYSSLRNTKGFPDLVLVRPPKILFIELKVENGRLSAAQFEWLSQIGKCDQIDTAVWRPSHLTDHTITRILEDTT